MIKRLCNRCEKDITFSNYYVVRFFRVEEQAEEQNEKKDMEFDLCESCYDKITLKLNESFVEAAYEKNKEKK